MSHRRSIAATAAALSLAALVPGESTAVGLIPERLDLRIETRRRSIEGRIELTADRDRIDLRLHFPGARPRKLVVRVRTITAALRIPVALPDAMPDLAGVKRMRVRGAAVHVRLRPAGRGGALEVGPLPLFYESRLQPGDQLELLLGKGRRKAAAKAIVTPEPGTAALLWIGLAAFGMRQGHSQQRARGSPR